MTHIRDGPEHQIAGKMGDRVRKISERHNADAHDNGGRSGLFQRAPGGTFARKSTDTACRAAQSRTRSVAPGDTRRMRKLAEAVRSR